MMGLDRTQAALGGVLLGAFGAFWRWHSPRAAPLTEQEIDRYLGAIAELPLPDAFVSRLRRFAESDDGKPVYMINLFRFYPENRHWPGAPEFDGTPEEANAHYERTLTPLWFSNAAYPLLGGGALGDSLLKTRPDDEPWSQARVVRYPNRRTFLRLLADPGYAEVEPYKMMSSESDLVAVSGDVSVPDPRIVVGGGLLAIFLGVGWWRGRRR